MDLTEAINSRHSVRQFTDQPVEQDLIKKVVKLAQRAHRGLIRNRGKFTVQWANRWRKLRRHIMRKI